MIKIKTKHGGVDDVEIGEDGHWSFTYVPQSEDDFPCIVHSGIPADEIITYLQLEDGTRATHWVPNTVEESELAKLWNNQREIRLNFTNELEQLEGKVQIRTDGILTEFKDLETKTESSIIQTANNIRAEVKDDINKLEGRINLNAHGLESKFEDHKRQMSSQLIQTSDIFQTKLTDQEKQFNSKITQTSQGIRSEINDVERTLNSRITQTSQGIRSEVNDVERTLNSRITQTSEGIKSEVSDVKRGLESQITQTSSGLTSSINDLETKTRSLINQTSNSLSATIDSKTRGVRTDIMADLDKIILAVRDNKRLTSSSLELTKQYMRSAISNNSESAIRTMVPSMIQDEINGINYRSIFQQQADNIMLAIGDKIPEGKMTGKEIVSAINLSTGGVRIKGETIALDGNTTMTNAFARKLVVDNLNATDITAFTGKFARVIANQLDVNHLTGNKATFIQALFNGSHSNLKITGNGIDIVDRAGRSSTKFDDGGINFYRAGVYLGKLEYVTNASITDRSSFLYGKHGISMRPQRNAYFAVSTFPSQGGNSIRRFAVDGDTGTILLAGKILGNESQNDGIRISTGTIGGSSAVFIVNHSQSGGIAITNGDLYYKSSNGKWNSLNTWLR